MKCPVCGYEHRTPENSRAKFELVAPGYLRCPNCNKFIPPLAMRKTSPTAASAA